MSIFDLHSSVVEDYKRYVRSFLSIADIRIREFVEKKLIEENIFWPDALLQLNPAYQLAETVAELASSGLLTSLTADIFRDEKGDSIRLYKHQADAVRISTQGQSYVVTSGTGSGKSLTYFIPIFDAVLRGNHLDSKVWAIVIYPMNALVNSQFESLKAFGKSYQAWFGRPMPIRFDKYTGQENDTTKSRIQAERPHILLTNFMMLEMMLVRPQEAAFVDKTTSALQFLVLDEIHMYRGRQGADVAMLIRRLKDRCGNPNVRHIGTSATMVADRSAAGKQRRLAVAEFAGKLFGKALGEENVIEETLVPVSLFEGIPAASELESAVSRETPSDPSELLRNPLTAWIEHTVGIRKDQEGIYRRQIPQSLPTLCQSLAKDSGSSNKICEDKLREVFLRGSRAIFAFKLHQFFSQGRTAYATLERGPDRFFSLDGQYYGPPGSDPKMQRLLFPILFCRVCGQEYYKVVLDEAAAMVSPWDDESREDDIQGKPGYLLLPPDGAFHWSNEDLPPEWVQLSGRVIQNYRNHVPRSFYVRPDGGVFEHPSSKTVQAYYQPSPFLICQSCGEYYTLRDRDFRKLTGLSNEGRSSATTTLSITSLDHAEKAGITGPARKLLSFTDNRQDASLQAGHFNDFVLVGLLRSAIYKALDTYGELRHYNIAEKTKEALGLELQVVAHNPNLDPNSPAAVNTWRAFQDLIQYRIYEDLRRAWRVVHPNLEQCGLLRIEYEGLEQACQRDDLWNALLPMAARPAEERLRLVKPVLDLARRKLAIHAEILRETYQQQLRQRVNQLVNERWAFDDSEERLRSAEKLILPDQAGRLAGVSLGIRSLVWRFLRRALPEIADYNEFLHRFVAILVNQGLLRQDVERGVQYVQLDSSALIWRKGDGTPVPPDPIYSRRASSPIFVQVQQKANEFFKELYESRGQSLRDVEGLEHTAQIKYENRERREKRFRDGDLKVLFCSPTMELGIDIRDLQLVHLRNVPPTPASYAQRSGRAGRKGDPALILTYCSARSGHDQYFFQRREDMVAGFVRPPRIDISNEYMVRAHMHAVWFAKLNLVIERSIEELLNIQQAGLPLRDNIKGQSQLSENRLRECVEEGQRILDMCSSELRDAEWYRPDWLDRTMGRASESFDKAFDRWRQLFEAATKQLSDAQAQLNTALDTKTQQEAGQRIKEAVRQRNLLMNIGTTREESDFYPYRYLASEGFLPGYNFPRLPIRVFVPREDGEFIGRARFLALSEFGPENLIYHEGAKYQVNRFVTPPGGLAARRSRAKLCNICGYFNEDINDRCDCCKSILDGGTSLFVHLLEMPNAKSIRRERITCDEEERVRRGYRTSVHFRFASANAGGNRKVEADVGKDPNQPLFRALFAAQANLFKVNHGWKGRNDDGFRINLSTGDINPSTDAGTEDQAFVRLYVDDVENLLLLYPPSQLKQDDRALASLQFALQRGMEQYFQVEESELASERIGSGERRALLYWEAAEGGVGVLRRVVEEPNLIAKIAGAALERLHFDLLSGQDKKSECQQACYECLLSYSNQLDHRILNRHLIREILIDLTQSTTTRRHGGRDYEAHHEYLKKLTDSRSDLERKFLQKIYDTRRELPDEGQKALLDVNTIPDFYYSGSHVCVYCDGSVHDQPEQQTKDENLRRQLREHGYRVIVIRYDRELEEQIAEHEDVFGTGKK